MKRVLKSINAAAEEDTRMDDAVDRLKDDFDYAVAGLEKLGRSGAEATNTGLVLAEKLQTALQEIITSIGAQL